MTLSPANFKTVYLALCLSGAMLLASCGFHLRGDYQLPEAMSSVYLTGANTELLRDLQRALQSSGAIIVTQASDATAVLKVLKETNEQRVLSLDKNGRAREYELHYRVIYSVQGQGNDFNIDERTVDLTRDYVFDSEAVLGNSREQATLVRDMQRDAVRLILLQLQASRSIPQARPAESSTGAGVQ